MDSRGRRFDWGEGPRVGGRRTQLWCAWLAWCRYRIVLPCWDQYLPTVLAAGIHEHTWPTGRVSKLRVIAGHGPNHRGRGFVSCCASWHVCNRVTAAAVSFLAVRVGMSATEILFARLLGVAFAACFAMGGTLIVVLGYELLRNAIEFRLPRSAIYVDAVSPRPLDALRRIGSQGFVFATVLGLLGGGLVAFAGLPTIGAAAAVFGGLTFALWIGPTFGLAVGLDLLFSHFATRLLVAFHALLPMRLGSFLDAACALGVMYPAGPGYRFRHRTLADHLANAYDDDATRR